MLFITRILSKISRISKDKFLTLFLIAGALVFASYLNSLYSTRSLLLSRQNVGIHQVTNETNQSSSSSSSNVTKTILVWNGSGRKEVRNFGWGSDAFVSKHCPNTRCEMTDNRAERPLEHYDAIVIVLNDEFTSPEQMMMPQLNKRNTNQRLVMFTQESPPALQAYYNMTQLAHFFNWTMTYRMNADIPLLYGRIIPNKFPVLTPEEINVLRQTARQSINRNNSNKTKTIAWMVSHCNTHGQRETYVKELSNYLNVDIYGRCGNLTCALDYLHHSDPQCYVMLESTYKFYISFENAICPDYVTEKFFKIMGHNLVPIVYGGADYSRHAPPHSYIDARQFKPKELAAYLKLLDANETLYNEYFWWKDHYRVEYSVEDMTRHGFCDLCQKLHDGDKFESYKEMASDWGDDNKCQPFDTKWIQ